MLQSRSIFQIYKGYWRLGGALYSSRADDPDLMQRTIIPTDHFQKSLPRLPIPKLDDTVNRYLNAQTPLLSAQEFEETKKLAEAFRTEGKELHDLLTKLDKENKHTSYISGPWFSMYLCDRRAVALNHNPFMAFVDDPKPEYNNQLLRATNFAVSSLRFWKTYRKGQLEPEVFHLNPAKTNNRGYRNVLSRTPEFLAFYVSALAYKAYPLDMSQFPRLMNSTRIPRKGKDELFSDYSAKHLLVMRKGHFYVFDVIDDAGRIKSPTEIQAHLKYILDDNSRPAEHPVGIMTSQNRDLWTETREKLVEQGNEALLNKIDSAAFALILDDTETEDPMAISKLFLHSDGTNRWFDKSFSLIMTKTGKACVNFEHAWGDGVAVLRYFNEVFSETTKSPVVHPDTQPANVDSAAAVTKLQFNLDAELKDTIQKAREDFASATSQLSLRFVKHERFGKNFIKKHKVSPDSFVQLGFQMAYYRMFGHAPATYESCSTAAFRYGRTETVRPATPETLAACKLFADKSSAVGQLQESMRACSTKHMQLTKEAAMGQGFDRHLFAMRAVAQSRGVPLPALYKDPAYARINHNILSTSTLSSPAVLIGGFAPVVPDGYGLGYGINDTNLGMVVTTYPERNGSDFLDAFRQSVDEMYDVLQGNDTRK